MSPFDLNRPFRFLLSLPGVLLLGLFFSFGIAQARMGTEPLSQQLKWKDAGVVETVHTPPVDPIKNLQKDKYDRNQAHKMLRFAEGFPLDVDIDHNGTWTHVPGKGMVWRVKIVSPNATDLNFGFRDLKLPKGATLHVVAEDHDYYQGPYTASDVQPDGQFWSPVVPGDNAVVEVFVPSKATFNPSMLLLQASGGYRDLFKLNGRPKQGPCNIDTICPEGDNWRDEIQSVGAYSVGGTRLCTGTMLRDADMTFRNFFLTAAHCGLNGGNTGSVVVYWNFESPTCGALSGGSLDQNTSGATFRASDDDVDMALIELSQDPLPSYNVYYAGWSSANTPAGSTVGIHHPNVDEKAICFNNNPVTCWQPPRRRFSFRRNRRLQQPLRV